MEELNLMKYQHAETTAPSEPDDGDDEHDDSDDEDELEELDLGCMKTMPGSLFQLNLSHQIFFSRHVLTPGT